MNSVLVFFVLAITLPNAVAAQTPLTPLRDASHRAVTYLSAGRMAPDTARAASQAVSPPPRSWADRHPVLLGTLLGLGVGATIGVASCKFPGAEGSSCADYTFPGHARFLSASFIGGVGAGIGAGVGAVIAASQR